MPKTTWGSDLDEEAIESAETRDTYTGPVPPKGVYRFKLKYLRQGKSKAGNKMVRFFGVLDGTYKDVHKKFDGAPLWVDTAVMASTAFRIKALVNGLGVTAKQFMTGTMTDDADPEPNIVKIGTKKITQDMLVYVNIRPEDGDQGERIGIVGGGFLPAPEGDDDSTPADKSASDDESEADKPKAKKDKKAKGGKSKGGEEPPF